MQPKNVGKNPKINKTLSRSESLGSFQKSLEAMPNERDNKTKGGAPICTHFPSPTFREASTFNKRHAFQDRKKNTGIFNSCLQNSRLDPYCLHYLRRQSSHHYLNSLRLPYFLTHSRLHFRPDHQIVGWRSVVGRHQKDPCHRWLELQKSERRRVLRFARPLKRV